MRGHVFESWGRAPSPPLPPSPGCVCVYDHKKKKKKVAADVDGLLDSSILKALVSTNIHVLLEVDNSKEEEFNRS